MVVNNYLLLATNYKSERYEYEQMESVEKISGGNLSIKDLFFLLFLFFSFSSLMTPAQHSGLRKCGLQCLLVVEVIINADALRLRLCEVAKASGGKSPQIIYLKIQKCVAVQNPEFKNIIE